MVRVAAAMVMAGGEVMAVVVRGMAATVTEVAATVMEVEK